MASEDGPATSCEHSSLQIKSTQRLQVSAKQQPHQVEIQHEQPGHKYNNDPNQKSMSSLRYEGPSQQDSKPTPHPLWCNDNNNNNDNNEQTSGQQRPYRSCCGRLMYFSGRPDSHLAIQLIKMLPMHRKQSPPEIAPPSRQKESSKRNTAQVAIITILPLSLSSCQHILRKQEEVQSSHTHFLLITCQSNNLHRFLSLKKNHYNSRLHDGH